MRYHNFELWINQKDKASLKYHLRALTEDFESAHGVMQLDPDSVEIIEANKKLVQRQTDRPFMIHVGTLLHDALFSPESRAVDSLFQEYSGKSLKPPHDGIRLRLRIEAPEIAALPWEFLYSPLRETFFSTWIDNPLVRYLDVRMPVPALETSLPIRILVVIPSSPDLPNLKTAEERGVLLKALEGMEGRVQSTFLEGSRASMDQIEEALDEHRFHIFHFIGHGDFVGDQGVLRLGAKTVDHETLGQLFQNREDMKLVVLNACKGAKVSPSGPFMGIAPQLVKRGVPAVVAMQYSVYDEVAIRFCKNFYHSLFKGTDRGRIDMAITHARNALWTEYPGQRAFGAPVLFLHAPQGLLFDLPEEETTSPLQITRSEDDRLQAVKLTHAHSLDVVKKSSELDPEKKAALIQELEGKVKQTEQTLRSLRFRKMSVVAAVAVALLVFFLFWVSLFDYFTLDTKVESYTMALGDLFVHKQLHEDIVLIPIDNRTEKEVGRKFDESWRKDHAILVNKLSQAGAAVIVFDMCFERGSEFDGDFAQAMCKAKKDEGPSVIIGARRFEGGRPVIMEELRSAASGWGAPVAGSKTGYAWVTPLAIKKDRVQQPVPGLALEAFAAYDGADRVEIVDFNQSQDLTIVRSDSPEPNTVRLHFFESDTISAEQASKSDDILDKGDVLANLAIDRTPRSMIRDKSRRFSYTDILKHSNPKTLTQFKDKIVMVGVGIEGSKDFHDDRWGFEWQADAINTLLNGVEIRSVSPCGQFALIVVLSIVGGVIRTRTSHVSRRLAISLLIIVLLVYLAGTIYLYAQYKLLLNTVYHVVALLLTYWVVGKLERRYFQ